jgi:hypothetical protein
MKGYKIATINKKEEDEIKKAEKMIKDATGKELVFIAWQKDDSNLK